MRITLITGPANAGQGAGRDGRRSAPSRPGSRAAARRADARPTSSTTCASWPASEAAMGVRVTVFCGPDRGDRAPRGSQRAGARRARARAAGRRRRWRAGERRGPASARARRAVRASCCWPRVAPRAPVAPPLDAALGDEAEALGFDLGRRLRRLPAAPGTDRPPRRAAAGAAARSTRCASVPRCGAPTPVLFYGFDDLTPLQLDAIETLGRVVEAPR